MAKKRNKTPWKMPSGKYKIQAYLTDVDLKIMDENMDRRNNGRHKLLSVSEYLLLVIHKDKGLDD